MKKLSYDERDYAARLEEYIVSEKYTHALYKSLANRCRGSMASALRSMSADEGRHLKAMQMEYYLLTGDSCAMGDRPDTSGELHELLRRAYEGEGGAAEDYATEARRCSDKALRELYLAQSADETRHRAMVKRMLGNMTGMK